jgi:hypothetical protein
MVGKVLFRSLDGGGREERGADELETYCQTEENDDRWKVGRVERENVVSFSEDLDERDEVGGRGFRPTRGGDTGSEVVESRDLRREESRVTEELLVHVECWSDRLQVVGQC